MGAPLGPQAVQDEQYLGASRHQHDLMDLWWRPWKKQGSFRILAYVHLKETGKHANLETEPCTVNRELLGRPDKEDQEGKIDVQRMVLLGSTDKVELLRTPASHVPGPLGARCPGPPSDTATQKDITADVALSHNPSDLTKETGLEDANETKGNVHDELLKDIDTQQAITTDDAAERAADEKPAAPGHVLEEQGHLA